MEYQCCVTVSTKSLIKESKKVALFGVSRKLGEGLPT